ncbi:FliH/SctL family protein [Nitrospirillum bahiense]|uniref:Uncharacterized protein n=1 Tax=Nitrospirillum amazonense TaxID=28077 RepID=A0A560FC66_9PROT|nr:hypothetical protein [Nitrospirillum amazonense]TWB19208.1 hypothetical protein FBZ88_12263 [Nitrospirillum amazonense]
MVANHSINRDRLLKLLALSESPHDGEALGAVRKAAAMARAAGLSLPEAMTAPVPVTPVADFEAQILRCELAACRRRLVDLEGRLAAGADGAQLEAAHAQGYRRGQEAGRIEGQMEANARLRELEVELEAYRPPLDWPALAERFAHKNQRGAQVAFARGVLMRARIGQLTLIDRAALRRFAAPSSTRVSR